MQTKDAAKGRWPEIYGHFGFQIIVNKHQVCPMCDRKGSSGIRIHDKTGNGDWICVCGNGYRNQESCKLITLGPMQEKDYKSHQCKHWPEERSPMLI